MSDLEWVDALKVVELKKQLKDLGQNTTGKKAVLADRLKKALSQQKEEEKEETKEPEGDKMEEIDDEEKEAEVEEEKKGPGGGLNELLGDGKDDLEFDYESEKPNRKKQKMTETVEAATEAAEPVEVKETEKPAEEELVDFETAQARTPAPQPSASQSHISIGETKPAETPVKGAEMQRTQSGTETMEIEAPVIPEEDRTCALRIQNFVRPFTEKAAKEMLSTYGTVVDMWMPPIKTHCFVIYEKESEAHDAYLGTYHVVWPRGGKHLKSQFVSSEEAKKAIEDGRSKALYARASGSAQFQKTRSAPFAANTRTPMTNTLHHGSTGRQPNKPALSLEDLFCKTQTKPPIYYLPLTDEQVTEKKRKAMEKSDVDEMRGEDAGRKTA